MALGDIHTTAHISGGFGFVRMLHSASCVPKIGPWQEYNEGEKQHGDWFDPPLRILDGALTMPKGLGEGLAEPKELRKDEQVVKARM